MYVEKKCSVYCMYVLCVPVLVRPSVRSRAHRWREKLPI